MRNRIYFEGGLGSQLFSAMTYFVVSKVRKTYCDFSYFRSQNEVANPNLSFWNWKLNHYGLEIDHFPSSSIPLDSRLRKFKELPTSQSILNSIVTEDFRYRFPVTNSYQELRENLLIGTDEKYACIHVRQGDYLKVAVRVISVSETIQMIYPLASFLPKRIFLISDSHFSSDEMLAVEKVFMGHRIEYVIDGNDMAVHGLMRNADFLITSNSTFSLSAMVLAKSNQLSISPNNFHGIGRTKENSRFVLYDSWSINNVNRVHRG